MPHTRATHCPLCGSNLKPTDWEGRTRPKCQGCGFVYFFNPASAAAGLVLDATGGKVLLVRRRIQPFRGAWALPAGYQEIDEEPQEAVRREVSEETGLEVEVQRLLDVAWVGDDPRKPANVIIYLCTVVGGQLRAASDVSEVAWFSLTDLPEDMGFDNRDLITRFLDRE
ncbi:MAG TPA: NUDIX hydrolase [Planctomycetes bacterium]|nr:NUDIX hydrolase [Planctomycetota bacterium]HIK62214.1 NUDIX hydrolase [Planctomycetota bacterium]